MYWIQTILLIVIITKNIADIRETFVIEPHIGPKGMPYNKTTSCKDFGKFARFNIHSVVDRTWFVFYYWALPQSTLMYVFNVPTTRNKEYFRYIMHNRLPSNFNWSEPMLLMTDIYGSNQLLVEKGDRGQYWAYDVSPDGRMGDIVKPRVMRFKQIENNKYIAFMYCTDHTAFIMSKIPDLPSQEKLQVEASKLGYRGRKGKSYLYQGHQWMPISERDQKEYWRQLLSRLRVTAAQQEQKMKLA